MSYRAVQDDKRNISLPCEAIYCVHAAPNVSRYFSQELSFFQTPFDVRQRLAVWPCLYHIFTNVTSLSFAFKNGHNLKNETVFVMADTYLS